MDSNPEVMKYVSVPPVKSISESENIIKNLHRQYKEFGTGRLAIIEKESGNFVGWSGLKFLEEPINNIVNVLELGYRLMPEFWGKGYAYEASMAVLNQHFKNDNSSIFAMADVENLNSNKILKKLGFIEISIFEKGGRNCFWYELSKSDFPSQI